MFVEYYTQHDLNIRHSMPVEYETQYDRGIATVCLWNIRHIMSVEY
jgi:hypothetical protein